MRAFPVRIPRGKRSPTSTAGLSERPADQCQAGFQSRSPTNTRNKHASFGNYLSKTIALSLPKLPDSFGAGPMPAGSGRRSLSQTMSLARNPGLGGYRAVSPCSRDQSTDCCADLGDPSAMSDVKSFDALSIRRPDGRILRHPYSTQKPWGSSSFRPAMEQPPCHRSYG
jgi:hypothetical protein